MTLPELSYTGSGGNRLFRRPRPGPGNYMVNESKTAATSAGIIAGRMITKNTFKGPAPRSFAASSKEISNSTNRERITTVAYAEQNVTCAIQIVIMPLSENTGTISPNVTNSNSKARPDITSGKIIGAVINSKNALSPWNFLMLTITKAASVPMTTDVIADISAIVSD